MLLNLSVTVEQQATSVEVIICL